MNMQETMTVMLTRRSGQRPEPVAVPARVGTVRVGELLGEGGGGAVFSGYDEALSRKVAVKVLHKQTAGAASAATQELVTGVRSAAQVKHPNIVTVHTVEMCQGMPVIVMEYVDGASLRALLDRTGVLEPSLGLFIMRSIVSAVAALHEATVVHRDLKPANILFDRDAIAHVCDFGLACEVRSAGSVASIGGSPLYMAPEMFDGQVSAQTDVYALGLMMFELLAGRAPFNGKTIPELERQHRSEEVPLTALEQRGLGEDVIDIVRRATNKPQFLRYKTAGHLLRALQQLEHERDDVLQMRLAKLVIEDHAASDSATRTISAEHLTTFDLLASKAQRKRAERGD